MKNQGESFALEMTGEQQVSVEQGPKARRSKMFQIMGAKSKIASSSIAEDSTEFETTPNATHAPKPHHKHPTKIIPMFLATLFCSHLQVSCHLQPLAHQTGSGTLHKAQQQRQQRTLSPNQFSRAGGNQQHFYQQQQALAADRRVQAPANGSQQQQAARQAAQERKSDSRHTGRVLVCYYTSARNGATPWPPVRESREFVIPAESLNSIQTEAMLLANQPLMAEFGVGGSNYYGELFGVGNLEQQAILANQINSALGKRPNNVKNQQQPLFKLSQSIQTQASNIPRNQLSASVGKSPANLQENNHRKTTTSHTIATRADHLATASAANSFVFNGRGHKSKQTPAYNFVEGDLDANGAFIVSGGVNQAGAIGPEGGQQVNGNNGANFVTAPATKPNRSNNNGNHPARLPQQQHQLVFSPAPSSQSRAFIVNSSNNNEILDTKSQLLFPSTLAASSSPAVTLLATALQPTTNSPSGLYQQVQLEQKQRAKNLHFQPDQFANQPGQLYQQAQHYQANLFSGTVSSAPPVPLSTASLQQLDSGASARNLQLLPAAGSGARLHPASASKSTLEPAGGGFGQSLAGGSPSELLQQVASNQQQQQMLQASGKSPLESAPAIQQTSLVGGALSSVLVSSPLSSVFDAFGAASQYLMRFKPSSLISPGSLAAFSGLGPPEQTGTGQGQQQPAGNSSQIASATGSQVAEQAAYMIPLPFASSGLISSSKSAPSSPAPPPPPPSFNQDKTSESNLLSRLSLGQANQRREDVCGRTIQTPQRRIIGGEGARYGEFPYQVHIKIAKHQCGGALVDRQSIVTAAHCVYHFITRAPVSKLQIVIGAYDIEDEQYQELPPQYFKVNKVKLHPNFRFSASHPDRYDIAILKLDKPVKYTDNVLPVCLPSKELKLESLVGTVTGFGKTDPSLSNRYGTRLLQKVDVPIIENNECERWHRTRGIDLKIFPEMMCAGYEDGLKDACVGDSGGPLVVKTSLGPNGSYRWTLAGITSAGFGCAQSRQPGIYHRVSHTVDWILENLD